MEKKNLRILAFSDTHQDMSLMKRLVKKAEDEDVDVVLFCGDFTNDNDFVENLIGPFLKIGKKVLLLPGNHEDVSTVDLFADVYKVTNLHGKGREYNGIGLFGCSANNIGPFAMADGETTRLLDEAHAQIKHLDKKVMVTHVHASGGVIEKLSQFVHANPEVNEAVEKFKPDVLICGHVHEAEGLEEHIGNTRVLNVVREGKIFDI